MEDVTPRPTSEPSRRTVLKVAAWSAPVVAVAVAAPFASASSGKLPTDYIVSAGITGQAEEGATNAGDIFTTTGTITLNGKAGDSSGVLTAFIVVPNNYTAQNGQGGAAFVVGNVYNGWTLSSTGTLSGGRKTLTFTHPALTIPTGSTSTSTSFSTVVYMALASGQPGAPSPGASNTSGRFRIGASSIVGGQYAADSFFPALED